jgi:flagellar biosynthesis regulator FlaF
MKNIDGKLAGILGTVIIHLIAGIIFMSFKMHSLDKDYLKEFTVEFAQIEKPEVENKLIELPVSRIESILQGDEELLNIARNLANKSEEKIDPADYIDKVKEELIRDGKLGEDNYIDEQKRLNELSGDEKLAFENDEKPKEEDKPKESQEMAANYKGPTRIYYDLAGRNHTYLPIPIYKCQGSGKVVLAIIVNQKGVVEEAKIIPEVSSTADPCLAETAVNTALISRFNPDISSPKIQAGTLTYEFVAQ